MQFSYLFHLQKIYIYEPQHFSGGCQVFKKMGQN